MKTGRNEIFTGLVFFMFLMPAVSRAQQVDTVYLVNSPDSTLLDTVVMRSVGDEILKRTVSLSNRCSINVEVKLSADRKSWKQLFILPGEEKLFVIRGLETMYLLIDPGRPPGTVFKLYKGDRYEIRWSSMEDNYMLRQL
jgi:hypothetical protein